MANVIFDNKAVQELFEWYDCALGLDVSRRSTGVCLYQHGVLHLYIISVNGKYSKQDTLWEAKMKKEFKKELEGIVRGKHFDLVVVENTINGCNAITNKELVLLNSIFDELVADGICTVADGKLIRPLPNVWRRELKNLHDVKWADNTKHLVSNILSELGYAFCKKHKDETETHKKNSGYFDICDATGMLVGYMHKFASYNRHH